MSPRALSRLLQLMPVRMNRGIYSSDKLIQISVSPDIFFLLIRLRFHFKTDEPPVCVRFCTRALWFDHPGWNKLSGSLPGECGIVPVQRVYVIPLAGDYQPGIRYVYY